MASCRPPLFAFERLRNTIAVMLICCLAFLVLLTHTVYALDPNKRLTQFLHTSWRLQDGSAPAGMYAITQTSDGFLWLLSSRGEIYRFDGVQFLAWHLPADIQLIGKIRNIIGDRQGGLWALGADGVAHLKNGNVTAHFSLQGLMPNAGNVTEDPDGSLWVVRGENGVSEPVCHVTDQTLKCFGKSDGIPISPIDAISADGKGGFWLGGQVALVHWHSGMSESYPIKGLKSNTGAPGIMSLASRPDGSVWVGLLSAGVGQGLARLEGGTVKSFVTCSFDGSKFGVFSLHLDQQGNLWVGSDNDGVFRVHGDVVDHYARSEGLSGDFVRAFFEDREGLVWAATSDGVDKFQDMHVTTFSTAEGLPKDWAVGVSAGSDGSIWVANAESLDHIGPSGAISSIRTGSGLPGSQVSSVLEDHAGNLWVGVDDGLYLFKGGRFRRLPEPNHQPLGLVFELIEDTDGNIWAESARSGKLVRIRNFQVQEELSQSQIPSGRLAPDPNGGIWIGAHSGELVLFRNGNLKRFPVASKPNPSANQLIAQADGSVLAAFDDGLAELREGKLRRMTTKNGLPCDAVISFIEDKENHWWLNTQCGIVEFSDSELQRWWNHPEAVIEVRFYDVLDGARPSSLPPFHPAAISSDGRVWFVNSGVVQMVDPSRLSRKALPAQTYIESVIVDRKEFPASDNLKLSPHPRDLQIDYTAPSFTIARKVKFRYRLDPYDRDWHEAGTRRQAFYTDLPPGKYSFRVIAANSDGVWNNRAAKLDFSVTPAYYQTNWFRGLCVATFLALLWLAHQLRLRQLQGEFNAAIEARVSERTRIARELHDTLLQSLQALLFQYQAARNLFASGSERALQVLDSTLDRTEQAIAESRDAIGDIRSGVVALNALPELLATAAGELAESHADHPLPTFGLTVEGERRTLTPIMREEIYRIGLELLRNAFRHANAQRVEAEIRYDDDVLCLRIRDDGRGMDLKLLQKSSSGHWGLRGVRERAERIGAKLDAWSEAGAGTEFQLTVPAGRAYAASGDSLPSRLLRKVKGYAYRN